MKIFFSKWVSVKGRKSSVDEAGAYVSVYMYMCRANREWVLEGVAISTLLWGPGVAGEGDDVLSFFF